MRVLQDVISSSLRPAAEHRSSRLRKAACREPPDLEEGPAGLADRRSGPLHAVMRMNGARALQEDLAKRRLYVGACRDWQKRIAGNMTASRCTRRPAPG